MYFTLYTSNVQHVLHIIRQLFSTWAYYYWQQETIHLTGNEHLIGNGCLATVGPVIQTMAEEDCSLFVYLFIALASFATVSDLLCS